MNQMPPARVILVEDDEDHAHLITRSLRRSEVDCEVQRFADGVAVTEYLETAGTLPDVILLDLNLPKKGGLEVLGEIRGNARLGHLNVVILSTSTTQVDRESAYEAGASSYLVKPVDFEKFQEMISATINYWGRWNRTSAT
ncbi:response regulator [bacterium]|nr:response regulator [bacterium]